MTTSDLKLERRKRFLESLIKEAVINVLAEQQPPEPPPAAPPTPPMAPEAPAPETPQPEGPQAPQEFTVDDMIERLNVVRGGRSFTDPEVYGQLVTWFKKLNEDQKVVLQNFLVDLGKIVINVQGDGQNKPEDQGMPAQPPAPPAAPQAPPVAPGPAPAPPSVAPPV